MPPAFFIAGDWQSVYRRITWYNQKRHSNDAVLGEVRALRVIVLNLFFDLAKGEEITVESVREIIAKADAKKGS